MIKDLTVKDSLSYKVSLILAMALMIVIFMPMHAIDISYFHSDDNLLIARLQDIISIREFFLYIFNTDNFKFRPIANLQYYLEYLLFRNFFNLYILYNILLINIIVFYFIKIIFNSSAAIKVFSSLIIVSSVFVVYSAWNITGSFESLSAIFFLIIINSIINKTNTRYIMILSFLLIMTSEKYLPFLILLPFFTINKYYYNKILTSIIYSIGILCLYALIRSLLGLPFIVGTQTDVIQNSFDFYRFLTHLLKSFLELFGFSTGPRYLTGFEIIDWIPISQALNNPIYARGLYLNIIFLFFSLLLFIDQLIYKRTRYIIFLIIVLCAASAASVTFRLELRWLMPAYLVFLLYLVKDNGVEVTNKSLSLTPRKYLSSCILWSYLVIALVHNFYYISHFRSDLYFSGKLNKTPITNNVKVIVDFIYLEK